MDKLPMGDVLERYPKFCSSQLPFDVVSVEIFDLAFCSRKLCYIVKTHVRKRRRCTLKNIGKQSFNEARLSNASELN